MVWKQEVLNCIIGLGDLFIYNGVFVLWEEGYVGYLKVLFRLLGISIGY